MSEKIQRQHLVRKAMLYVRQSSAYQVSHNVESQALQYAMQGRLQQLGWHEIEVVDIRHTQAIARVPHTRWRRGRSRGSPATIGTGSSWSKSAGWSIPC